MKAFDIVIVGGGIIGLGMAYELRTRSPRLRIAVLDRGLPGRESSWAAAGMLEPQLTYLSDHFLPDPERQRSFFNLCRESQLIFEEYVRHVEWVSKSTCDYRKEGILKLVSQSESPQKITAWYSSLGLRADYWTEYEAGDREPALDEGFAAIHLPDNHQVDNRKLVIALAEACRRLGVNVLESQSVTEFVVHDREVTSVRSENERYVAPQFILCGGAWSSQFENLKNIVPDIRPIRGQMVALQMPRKDFVRYATHGDGFYYVPRNDGRLIVGSTVEDVGFDKSVKADMLNAFLAKLVKVIPAAESFEVVEEWAGLRPKTADGYPILGGTELTNLSIATGHFRNGILLMPITAKLMTDYVLEKRVNMLMKPFGVGRLMESTS